MRTDGIRASESRYRKKALKQIIVKFYPKDYLLYDKIKASEGSVNETILRLLREAFGE